MDNLGNILLIICVGGCVVPLILVGAALFWLLRTGQKHLDEVLAPDVGKLQAHAQKVATSAPALNDRQVVQRLINRQAMRCGVIGAVTGLGGLITLPVALPIDILASMRMQAALVEYIAQHYGHTAVSGTEQTIRNFILVSGGEKLTTSTTQYATKFLVRFAGKSLSKLVPLVGAAVGFIVNYAIVQATGRAAVRLYGRPTQIAGTTDPPNLT